MPALWETMACTKVGQRAKGTEVLGQVLRTCLMSRGSLLGHGWPQKRQVSFVTKHGETRAYAAFVPTACVSCQFPDYDMRLPYISLSS